MSLRRKKNAYTQETVQELRLRGAIQPHLNAKIMIKIRANSNIKKGILYVFHACRRWDKIAGTHMRNNSTRL